MPPRGWLYHFLGPEWEAMSSYIQDSLSAGIVQFSSSPAETGFFFVDKENKSLPSCIDYRGIKNIIIKNIWEGDEYAHHTTNGW